MGTCSRRLLLVVGLLLLPAIGFAQTPPTSADRQAIQTVINNQMAAFKRDDADQAFSFAAPSIQRMFGSAETFIAMVRQGYQPVYRPSQVRFADLAYQDGVLIQTVRMVGPDGAPVTALYSMEQQADGSWKIAGCQLTRDPGADT